MTQWRQHLQLYLHILIIMDADVGIKLKSPLCLASSLRIPAVKI